jgi:hypothetical protein
LTEMNEAIISRMSPAKVLALTEVPCRELCNFESPPKAHFFHLIEN